MIHRALRYVVHRVGLTFNMVEWYWNLLVGIDTGLLLKKSLSLHVLFNPILIYSYKKAYRLVKIIYNKTFYMYRYTDVCISVCSKVPNKVWHVKLKQTSFLLSKN